MWILKLHFAVCILLILFVIGIKMLFADRLKKTISHFGKEEDRKKGVAARVMAWLRLVVIMICPITNLIMALAFGYLALADEDTIKELAERQRG